MKHLYRLAIAIVVTCAVGGGVVIAAILFLVAASCFVGLFCAFMNVIEWMIDEQAADSDPSPRTESK